MGGFRSLKSTRKLYGMPVISSALSFSPAMISSTIGFALESVANLYIAFLIFASVSFKLFRFSAIVTGCPLLFSRMFSYRISASRIYSLVIPESMLVTLQAAVIPL